MNFFIFSFFICTVCASVLDKRTASKDSIKSKILNSINSFQNQPVLDKNATLKLLFIVHRHGERTLAMKFPTDPYALNASAWPDGDGQLTIPGKLRMYKLGQYLKERYNNFLTEDVRELHVKSSGLDRCIESAQLVAFAMYPPTKRWIWNENVTSFQPIPISSTIPNTDPMINPHAACRNGWAERAKIFQSEYVQSINKKNKDLFDFLSEHVGLEVKDIDLAKAVFDVLMVEQSMHYKLPNWTCPFVLSRLEKLYDQTFYIEFMTRRAQMFRTGVFFNELQEQILKRVTLEKKEPRSIDKFIWDFDDFEHYKVFLYSSHDAFISALLVALGNFDGNYPPFAATLMFEVHQNNLSNLIEDEMNIAKKNKIALDNTFFKIFYLKHTETKSPVQLRFSNCKNEDYCSFNEFFKFTQDLIITKEDWYKKCAE